MTRLATPVVVLAWFGIVGGGVTALMNDANELTWWGYLGLAVLVLAALAVTVRRDRAGDVTTIAAAVVGVVAAAALFVEIAGYPRYPVLFAGLCLLTVALVGAFGRSGIRVNRQPVGV